MQQYSEEIEGQMRAFYESLSEKDRRRYAGIEAKKLGHGGISYIARVLRCDRQTVERGMQELVDKQALEQKRIREEGGGRKSAIETIEGIEEAFMKVIENNTAGSPTKSNEKWTNLTQEEIAKGLKEEGINVSVTVVKQLLENQDFVKRKAQKSLSIAESEDRDKQFDKIAELKEEYKNSPNPIISIDTKKKRR
jgi:predicted transcriptional regulator